jgi:hypothetical protein
VLFANAAQRAVSALPLLAAVLAAGAVAARGCAIAAGGDERIVAAIPDDAFYYLVLAKRFALEQRWAFDGVSPTSGFHLVWAYLLAGCYALWPRADLLQVYVGSLCVGGLCHALAAYLVTDRLGQRLPGPATAASAIVVFGAGKVAAMGTLCMETPLVLLMAALTCAHLSSERPLQPRAAVIPVLLGLFGSLCRTDYVVLPAAFAVGRVLWARPRGLSLWLWSRAAFCTLGACLGIGLVALHTFAIAGGFVQASAATKAHWSALLGYDAQPALYALGLVLDGSFFPHSNVAAQLVVAACMIAALWQARRASCELASAGCVAVIAYVLLYRHNSAAIQPWYASSYAIPVFLVLAATLAQLRSARAAAALVIAACALTCFSQLTSSKKGWWPHQQAMMTAGQLLAVEQRAGATGAWNAGVLSYFSGGQIVNLDGLVNDEILDYARHNALLDYLALREVRQLADFGAMIREPVARKLGGYDTGLTDTCISLRLQLDKRDDWRWSDSEFGMYDVDLDCLRGAARPQHAGSMR